MFKDATRVIAVLLILAAIAVAFIVTPVISSHADTTSAATPTVGSNIFFPTR